MKIEQTSPFLLDVLRQVAAGNVVPAPFQRPYVWTQADVESLFDSLLSGFPVGSLLTWCPTDSDAPVASGRGRLGPISVSAAAVRPRVLLDGQNRLATLAWAMTPETSPLPADLTAHEVSVWGEHSLMADAAQETVRFVPREEASRIHGFPAWMLFGGAAVLPRLHALMNGPWKAWDAAKQEAALNWFDRATRSIRSARLSETTLDGATMAEARHAFARICKVGVPMSSVDFDAAIGWSPPNSNRRPSR